MKKIIITILIAVIIPSIAFAKPIPLSQQIINLKAQITSLTKENTNLKAEIARLNAELNKKTVTTPVTVSKQVSIACREAKADLLVANKRLYDVQAKYKQLDRELRDRLKDATNDPYFIRSLAELNKKESVELDSAFARISGVNALILKECSN